MLPKTLLQVRDKLVQQSRKESESSLDRHKVIESWKNKIEMKRIKRNHEMFSPILLVFYFVQLVQDLDHLTSSSESITQKNLKNSEIAAEIALKYFPIQVKTYN